MNGSKRKSRLPAHACKPLAISMLALAIAACSSGGGSKSSPPVTPTAPPSNTTKSLAGMSITKLNAAPTDTQAHLRVTGALQAREDGYVVGIPVALYSTGITQTHPSIGIANYFDSAYKPDPIGDGTLLAQIIAGKPLDAWNGGVAPGSDLTDIRIIPEKPTAGNPFGQVTMEAGLSWLENELKFLTGDPIARISAFGWDGGFAGQDATMDRLAADFNAYMEGHGSKYPDSEGMVVFAAGDGGDADPTQMAGLPSGRDQMYRQWITVAAVDTAHPDTLASYSNACGVAKDYCLVAPGDVVVTGADSTSDHVTYEEIHSTQAAMAQVAGAASVLFAEYPFLSAANVTQILLGTTTDLGKPGVDAVFGQGLLNEAKAVHGPGRLDYDMAINLGGCSNGCVISQLSSDRGTLEFSNDMSGTGGLSITDVRPGPDFDDGYKLILSGKNTYTGTTTMTGGTLTVTGSLDSPVVLNAGLFDLDSGQLNAGVTISDSYVANGYGPDFISENGKVIGDFSSACLTSICRVTLTNTIITGNVSNAGMGTVKATDSTINGNVTATDTSVLSTRGNVTINGDLSLGAQTVLDFQAGNPALQITGITTIDTGASLGYAGTVDGYVTSSHEVVLQAGGGVSGAFASIVQPDASGSYVNSTVFTNASIGQDANSVWVDFARDDVAATAAKFDGIKPASLASAQRVEKTFENIDAQLNNGGNAIGSGFIADAGHIESAANEAIAKSSLQSLSGELHARADAQTFDGIDANRRALSMRFGALAAQPTTLGAWSRQLGDAGEGSTNNATFAANGWMMGTDAALGFDRFAGIAFGETGSNGYMDGGRDNARQRQTQMQFYTGAVRGNAYALGQLGAGQYQRQMRRGLQLGDVNQYVGSDYAGRFFDANLETGYRLGAVTPYAGVDYQRLQRDGFDEAGGDGFGLKADASLAQRTQAFVGVRAQRAFGRIALHGFVEWQQALDQSGMYIDASFVGADAWSPLYGDGFDKSVGLFGASFDAALSRCASLSFGYDRRFASSFDDHQWMTKLRYGF